MSSYRMSASDRVSGRCAASLEVRVERRRQASGLWAFGFGVALSNELKVRGYQRFPVRSTGEWHCVDGDSIIMSVRCLYHVTASGIIELMRINNRVNAYQYRSGAYRTRLERRCGVGDDNSRSGAAGGSEAEGGAEE
jgi:hypothetical protein